MNRPEINVTPLIDVLLVLLIIFMIVTPTKLSSFKAKVPQEPQATNRPVDPHPDTLVVSVEPNSGLRLNREPELGSVSDPQPLIDRLKGIFDERHRSYGSSLPSGESVPHGVFIKAPPGLDYGSVAKVVDAVKTAGADPIALQIDDLN